jgi:ubiquinone/menaquinone biosynthesis C-methylase UbiE
MAAHVVARLTGDANRWMVDCLGVDHRDRVLDVGCGPGLAVAYAAQAGAALVVGVDVSPTMVRHALRRNRSHVRLGRVEIRRADAALLPYPDAHFTKAGSLNSLQFWPAPGRGLGEMYRVLAPGGRVAVVLMARSDEPGGGAPAAATPAWVLETVERMRMAGFADLRVESRSFSGVLHRALLGTRPEEKSGAPLDPTADGVRKGAAPSIRTMYGLSSRKVEC